MMDFDGYSVMCLLWKVSWQAAIFAAVVWTVTRLARKAPARFRHALWLLVLVKFLIPPFAHLPAELAVWQKTNTSTPAVIVTSPAPIRAAYVPSQAQKPSPQPDIVVPPTIQPLGPALPSPWDIAAIIWLAGIGLMAAALIIRCTRQRLLIRSSHPADPELTERLQAAQERLGVSSKPSLRCSEQVTTPMLVGLFHPTILLPPGLMDSCAPTGLDAMLLHELAHIKRRDMAVVWLHQLVQTAFFFHPALWLAGKELKRERELACDELVLSKADIDRSDYAAGYVSALKMANSTSKVPVSLAMAEPFEVEKVRLGMMFRERIPRLTWKLVVALAVVAALALPTYTAVRDKEWRTGGYTLERSWGGFGAGRFGSINGVAAGNDGFIYVADSEYQCVHKLSRTGLTIGIWKLPPAQMVSAVSGPEDIAVGTNGDVVVLVGWTVIYRLSSDGKVLARWGDPDPTTVGVHSDAPFGDSITVDRDGTVLVGNSGRERILRYDRSGKFLGKWTNVGTPAGLAVDQNRQVYMVDGTGLIRVLDSAGKIVRKWKHDMRDGIAASRIAVDAQLNVYVATAGGERPNVVVFDRSGRLSRQWRVPGTSILYDEEGRYDSEQTSLAVGPSGEVYVSNHKFSLVKCDAAGHRLDAWGRGQGMPESRFYWPTGVAVDRKGDVYVVDTLNFRVQKFTPDGEFIESWDYRGTDRKGVRLRDEAKAIAIDDDGFIYLKGEWQSLIRKFDPHGRLISQWGPKQFCREKTGHTWPPGGGIAVDGHHNVYITEWDAVVKLSPSGKWLEEFHLPRLGKGLDPAAQAVAVDDKENVYITDPQGLWVHKFDRTGKLLQSWGDWRGEPGVFHETGTGIAADTQGNIYVTDAALDVVRKFDSSGKEIGKLDVPVIDGTASPYGVAVAGDGTVYVTHRDGNRVLKFSRSGT